MIDMMYSDGRMDALVQKYACDDNLEWCPVQIVHVPKDLAHFAGISAHQVDNFPNIGSSAGLAT